MDSVLIRVELPSHSHVFEVKVDPSVPVSGVKEAISAACVGSPRPDGQRLIWRGRVLKDQELVQDVWKTADETRVVHLSVHPSAWTSAPPNASAPSVTQPSTSTNLLVPPVIAASHPLHSPAPLVTGYSDAAYAYDYFSHARARPTPGTPLLYPSTPAIPMPVPVASLLPVPSPAFSPLTYVLFRHNNALLAIMQRPDVSELPIEQMEGPRQIAIATVNRLGWHWPAVLDEPFPEETPGQVGATYERIVVNGSDYLSLTTPNVAPTARQVHALRVLGHTFPLLSLTIPNLNAVTNVRASRGHEQNFHPAMIPDLNNHLRQLGIPPLRVGGFMLMRSLLFPLSMLALRATILLYIFSPARKPVMALAVGAWVLYEVWNAITGVLAPQVRRANAGPGAVEPPQQQGAQANDVAQPIGPVANNQQQVVAAQANRPVVPATPRPVVNVARPQDVILEAVSKLNLDAEQRTLEARPEDEGRESVNAPPTMIYRARTFISLFITTLHPAVWDRRRAVLSIREGQIRTEASGREREEEQPSNADADLPEEERTRRQQEAQKREENRSALVAQHARRPRWVKEYVERVCAGEWVD